MKPHIRSLVAAAVAVACCSAPASAQRGSRLPRIRERAAGRGSRTQSVAITSGGLNRRYLLHVPPDAAGARPLPLVLAFHGGSQSPEDMESMSGLSTAADRDRFIAVYPEGIDKSWADGRGTTSADKKGVDDVAFTRAVLADIEKTHAVDRARVFATGPSNGGTFSHRLGCQMADTLAAIGPVIAAMPSNLAPSCRPSGPVAVVSIQGTSDPLMPFGGGEEDQGSRNHLGVGGRIESARATEELWRSIDGCGANPSMTALPARVDDGTSVTRRAFTSCRAATDVTWYDVQGGGHRWPPHQPRGPAEALARRAFGVSSQNIDATAVLVQFFSEHGRIRN